MTDEQIKVLKQAIDTYGKDAQLDMVIEECSELIKAICKYKRNNVNEYFVEVLEEAADVRIMLEQIQLLLLPEYLNYQFLEGYTDFTINEKIYCLKNRLEGKA